VKLLFTPPVLTVVTAPLLFAGAVRILVDGDAAIIALGVGLMVALFIIVVWLLLVVPVILYFGQEKRGGYTWTRVLIASCMGGFCLGSVLAFLLSFVIPGFFALGEEWSLLMWGLAHSYVALLAAFFLMRDPFFRHSAGKV